MSERHDRKPLRRIRVEKRETTARRNGFFGEWPPTKPRIESAADCAHYLARAEAGEHRAGFLAALGSNLVAFFQDLQPEHFRRFAVLLLDVAENPTASHRSRLRAVQAAIRPLHRAVAILPKLGKADDGALRRHLEGLLMAFCEELSADDFGRLAALLIELTGPKAKTPSDRVRACEAALTIVTDGMAMLAKLGAMARRWRNDDVRDNPEVQAAMARLRAVKAEVEADREEERRTGKPVRRDSWGRRIDSDGSGSA